MQGQQKKQPKGPDQHEIDKRMQQIQQVILQVEQMREQSLRQKHPQRYLFARKRKQIEQKRKRRILACRLRKKNSE